MKERYLTLDSVKRLFGIGKTSIYRLISKGFPRPIKIGRASRWVADEISDWIQARTAERERSRMQATADVAKWHGGAIADAHVANAASPIAGPAQADEANTNLNQNGGAR